MLTAADMPRLAPPPVPPLAHSVIPMQDDRVHYEGQPIALVAARTRAQAQHAASLVRARYAQTQPATGFGSAKAVLPDGPYNLADPDLAVGDVAAGMAAADVTVRQTYRTADRHHSPIEPSATMACWDGEQLSLQDSAQGIFVVQAALAAAFGLPADHVHVSCPFVGGGFGCKGFVHPHQLLTAAAARVLGLPVQLVLTRGQMFTGCGHQPATRQSVALGAARDGRLTAVEHDSVTPPPGRTTTPSTAPSAPAGCMPRRRCGSAPGWSGWTARSPTRCGRRTRDPGCSAWSRRWTSWPTSWE